MNVLQVQMSPRGSTSVVADTITRHLDPDRFHVCCAYLKANEDGSAKPAGPANNIDLGLAPWMVGGLGRWLAAARLKRTCVGQETDVMIAHRFKAIHLALIAGRALGIPVVGVVHGLGDYDRFYRRKMMKRLISQKDRFVAVSNAVREYLLSLDCGFTNGNTVVINNAIDFIEAQGNLQGRLIARQSLGIPADAVVVGTIGRLVPVKAHSTLVEAVATLFGSYPNLCLAIIGEGRCRPLLEEQIARLGVTGKVLLLGHREQASKYMSAFDIFALPSFSEGCPLTLLEAIAARLPVVGSSIQQIASVLGAQGYIHEPGNTAQLADRIASLLSMTDGERRTVGTLLYDQSRHIYDVSSFRASYEELLSDLSVRARQSKATLRFR